jgi:hypothetical protein
MNNVHVLIDSKWVKIINSPLYIIVQALTSVSVSFAPLFLYFAGEWGLRGLSKWLIFLSDLLFPTLNRFVGRRADEQFSGIKNAHSYCSPFCSDV